MISREPIDATDWLDVLATATRLAATYANLEKTRPFADAWDKGVR